MVELIRETKLFAVWYVGLNILVEKVRNSWCTNFLVKGLEMSNSVYIIPGNERSYVLLCY